MVNEVSEFRMGEGRNKKYEPKRLPGFKLHSP